MALSKNGGHRHLRSSIRGDVGMARACFAKRELRRTAEHLGSAAMLLGLALSACAADVTDAGAAGPDAVGSSARTVAPEDADSLAQSGRAHLAGGDYQAAVRDLSRAAALRPTDAAILADLGIAHDALGDFGGAYQQRVNIMRLMRACGGRCPEHGSIMAAFARLERRMAQP
jgi:hypothetical protein